MNDPHGHKIIEDCKKCKLEQLEKYRKRMERWTGCVKQQIKRSAKEIHAKSLTQPLSEKEIKEIIQRCMGYVTAKTS